jgi:FkbM family methyltransferase
MLIPFQYITSKYIIPNGRILHIGAHECEEATDYANGGFNDVIWIEGNPSIVKKMKDKYNIYEAIISDSDGSIVDFIITNNGQSSSILELEEHLREHPHIHEVARIPLKTITVDTLLKNNNIAPENIRFVNIDIQGAELLALRGMQSVLIHAKYIYLEINEKYLYRNCALIGDIDSFLLAWGFKRVETKMTEHGWGDALYQKL